jgi:hypothetical protein
MKKHAIAVSMVICLAVVSFAALFAQNAEPERPAAGTVRWQHLALTHDAKQGATDQPLGRQINQLGRDGWELVDVETVTQEGTTVRTVFYFKRAQ